MLRFLPLRRCRALPCFALRVAFVLFLAGSLAPTRAAITPVGDVSPSDLSTWNSLTTGYIGNTGSGTLTIDGGSSLLSASGLIGNGSTASGVVSLEGAGSTWTVNGTLSTGLSGAGTLSITGGGNLMSGYSCVGSSTGSTGTVTVVGNGSLWACSGLDVGGYGSGRLSIFDGGRVSVAGATTVAAAQGGLGKIDFGAGGGTLTTQTLSASPSQLSGSGTINTQSLITDATLVFDSNAALKQTIALQQPGQNVAINFDLATTPATNGPLGVGWLGAGSLTIKNGVTVNSSDGELGRYGGASGVAVVSGSGSAWIMQGGMNVGLSGSGTLSICSGGTVNSPAGGAIGFLPGSAGLVSVDGHGSIWTTMLGINVGYLGSGTLSITNGGTVTNTLQFMPDTYVGYQPGSKGVVTVDGPGSTWNGLNNLDIGGAYSMGGTLSVTNGGKVSNTNATISGFETSAAMVIVNGPGSSWTNNGSLSIGYNGPTTLSITNGGSVTSGNANIVARPDFGGASLVRVDGTGSLWTSGGLAVGADYGSGSLTITNGGGVKSNTNCYVASGNSATGLVTVDGPGSTWACSGSLTVGYNYGSGTISIAHGGSLSSAAACVGSATIAWNSMSLVTVDGPNSTWVSGNLTIGNHAGGTVTITNGGTVRSTNSYVGYASDYLGASLVTVDAPGSSWNVSNNLYVGCSTGFDGGSGRVSITNGGTVTSKNAYLASVVSSTGASGTVTVSDPGSTWTNAGSLTVGTASSGVGTLWIVGGGQLATNSLTLRSGLLAIDVGHGSSLSVGGGAGSISLPAGAVLRVFAGAGVAADGTHYTPVLSGNWTGTGTFQGVGGTLDKASHTFTPSPVTSAASGTAEPLELASVQRTLIDDGSTGWEVGASFPAASSTTNMTFTATPLGSAILAALQDQLPPDESLLSGWSFSTTNYSVSSANPVYLSFKVGAGHSSGDFDLWHYGGSAWARVSANDLTYDGAYANFTVTSFSGYALAAVPEPGTLVLLSVALVVFLAYARRK